MMSTSKAVNILAKLAIANGEGLVASKLGFVVLER